jgi:hypothetical protein
VGLDTDRLHKLRLKEFDKLYDKHKAKWDAMVEEATKYAKTIVGGPDKVRAEDISAVLQNGIKIDPDFELHLRDNSLSQKYWVAWFSDYVTEQVYPPMEIS